MLAYTACITWPLPDPSFHAKSYDVLSTKMADTYKLVSDAVFCAARRGAMPQSRRGGTDSACSQRGVLSFYISPPCIMPASTHPPGMAFITNTPCANSLSFKPLQTDSPHNITRRFIHPFRRLYNYEQPASRS